MVVTSPLSDLTGFSPVFISKKQPVPYVLFASPTSKQVCPKSAACWSPATPATGILFPKNAKSDSPHTYEDSFTCGSIDLGISSSFNISSSHVSVCILKSMVLEAFE